MKDIKKLTNEELEVGLSEAFCQFGLKTRDAEKLARETCLKARKLLNPTNYATPGIVIEDSYKVDQTLKIKIREGIRKDPRPILTRYLNRKKDYPAIENWNLELELPDFGGSITVFVAKLIPKPKKQKVSAELTLNKVASMSKEEVEALIVKLKQSCQVE